MDTSDNPVFNLCGGRLPDAGSVSNEVLFASTRPGLSRAMLNYRVDTLRSFVKTF